MITWRKVRWQSCDYGLVCHPVFFLLFFKTFRVAVLLKKLPARIDGRVLCHAQKEI